MKKAISLVLIFTLTMALLALSVSATSDCWVNVYINNSEFSGNVDVQYNTTYVGLRKFSSSMDSNASVTYNSYTRTLTVNTDNLYLTATDGDYYIVANGEYIYTNVPVYMKKGVLYVPVITLAKAFDVNIRWNDNNNSFYISDKDTVTVSGKNSYREDEVYWLSKIIEAEAGGESLTGKIAVGNVVLNRVKSSEFPDTIYGVIFDTKYGVQFTPAANGTIYNDASKESISAAITCLEGYSISDEILYFVNPKLAPNSWISKNGTLVCVIGNHSFYTY